MVKIKFPLCSDSVTMKQMNPILGVVAIACCGYPNRGAVVITVTQLNSPKLELRFCASSNPGCACRRFAIVRILGNGPD